MFLHPTQTCETHCHGLLGRSQYPRQPIQSEYTWRGFCFCTNVLSVNTFWSCSVFNHRWILEQAVIQTRLRCQDLGWPRPASRPSSQHTSLLTAQRLVKVRLLQVVSNQPTLQFRLTDCLSAHCFSFMSSLKDFFVRLTLVFCPQVTSVLVSSVPLE